MTIKEARTLIGNGTSQHSDKKSREEIQSMIDAADVLSDVLIGFAKDLYQRGGKDALATWSKSN